MSNMYPIDSKEHYHKAWNFIHMLYMLDILYSNRVCINNSDIVYYAGRRI